MNIKNIHRQGKHHQSLMFLIICVMFFSMTNCTFQSAYSTAHSTATQTPTETAISASQTPGSLSAFISTETSPLDWTFYDGRNTPGLARGEFHAIKVAPNGDIWAGTLNAISRFDGSGWKTYPIEDESPGIDNISVDAMVVTRDNEVWVGSYPAAQQVAAALLYRFNGQTWFKIRENIHVTAIEVGQDGTLWFALSPIEYVQDSPGGVLHFDGTNWTTYTVADGLLNDTVNDIALDQEGTLWFATASGISSFDGKRWENYPLSLFCPDCDQWWSPVTHIEIAPDKSIWFIVKNFALIHYENNQWIVYQNSTLFQDWSPVMGLCITNDGRVWIGKSGGAVSFAYLDGENWIAPTVPTEGIVLDIDCTSDGIIWLSTVLGVLRYAPSH